ncbi:xanthine dehydrogenase family protein molybdopterin-binding subunit [Mangrovibrevibacter kandeliae]|uniref:xanthine dehydrogenase family protein molybdopterin-binding subunit n=1 Tax=Mangrovibrevibacter kandeliae TaxID=2968473 RepID=UPI002118FEAD|nr:xanthine dehydrogenase family protein molybdopterin-binding subunit [Aurantimonas sp. CSK15Z-1]MCQ8784331.1 xanthine dehydrogenase family protein molybdopterin-binding subunit [Aurantimonas sp. CSK15Z-1]
MSEHTIQMDKPIGETRLDRRVQDVIGKGVARHEGPLKVSGRATYAYENLAGDGKNVAYGFIVTSTIGAGKIKRIDAVAALGKAGVLHVVTDSDGPRASADPGDKKPTAINGQITHYGQPVALVVAESFETARDAAKLVTVEYEPTEGTYALEDAQDKAFDPGQGVMPSIVKKGDFDKGFAAAEIKFDQTYTTTSQSHSAMEPHACVAEWNGDELTLYGCYQLVSTNVGQLAAALGIDKSHIRMVNPYIGGGFGGKLGIGPESVFAAKAAKVVGRPVKLALTRQQVYQDTSRRTDTIQRIRIGCDRNGVINAISHDTLCGNTPGDTVFEPAGISTVFLYDGENRLITHRLAEVNVVLASAMRAPGEAVGMLALENAMDELAEQLGIDPIELRKRNEPKVDPQDGKPFSSRMLVECMEEGAKRFGWADRSKVPGARREGEWLIGTGMAAASRKNLLQKASAKVELRPDGSATIETDMTDIGTGTYTILSQIAAEMLGLPLDKVAVTLGDSDLPQAPGSGGSWGANSSGSSVYAACEGIIEKIAAKLGVEPAGLTLKDGTVIADNKQTALTELLAGEPITVTGTFKPGDAFKGTHQASYGAHFCEVAVNAVTGETRVRRLMTVAAAGRILNEKTATSQSYGGQIFGIGATLTEELVVDPRTGLIVNHDLAEYHVPVNADVPQLEVVFLDERDHAASPLASKGIGELALSGVGAAISNAIHNATGIRLRDYPMTLDKVLAGWAAGKQAA